MIKKNLKIYRFFNHRFTHLNQNLLKISQFAHFAIMYRKIGNLYFLGKLAGFDPNALL
jgi:hypothetical protein